MAEFEDTLKRAREEVEKLVAQRTELASMLEAEKMKTEDAENCRIVAVSSLRNRWKSQKTQLEQEVQVLRSVLQGREDELSKLKNFSNETLHCISRLGARVAGLESGETVSAVSQELSKLLREISDVALVRPDDGQSLEEKMRDLRDGVRDLAKEVRARRGSAERSRERIVALEQEIGMWASTERARVKEILGLRELLDAAKAEIFILRRGSGMGGSSRDGAWNTRLL